MTETREDPVFVSNNGYNPIPTLQTDIDLSLDKVKRKF